MLDPRADAAALPPRGAAGSLDCAFDCAGNAAAVRQAMSATRDLVVLFAVQREPYAFEPEHWGGLILAGARPHTREAAEYAVNRLAEGRLDLGVLVNERMPLEDYARAVEMLRSQQATKIAFLPQLG